MRSPVTARSRLSPITSRPHTTDGPGKLNVGRPFWFPYWNVEICRYHRAQDHKGQRTQLEIRFAFCRTQLVLYHLITCNVMGKKYALKIRGFALLKKTLP